MNASMMFALEIMSFVLLVAETWSAILINEKPNDEYELLQCYTILEWHERFAHERFECYVTLKKNKTLADIEFYDHDLREQKMAVVDCKVAFYNGQQYDEFLEDFPGCVFILGETSRGRTAMWIYLLVGVGFISIIGLFTFIEMKYAVVRNYWRRKSHIPIDGSGGSGVAYIELGHFTG